MPALNSVGSHRNSRRLSRANFSEPNTKRADSDPSSGRISKSARVALRHSPPTDYPAPEHKNGKPRSSARWAPAPAFAKLVVRSASCTQTKRALTPLEIRYTHPGKQHALKLLRRKRNRNTNHRTKDPRIPQPVPERSALTHGLDFRFAERDGVFANLDMPLRPLDFSRRKIRKIAISIAARKS